MWELKRLCNTVRIRVMIFSLDTNLDDVSLKIKLFDECVIFHKKNWQPSSLIILFQDIKCSKYSMLVKLCYVNYIERTKIVSRALEFEVLSILFNIA